MAGDAADIGDDASHLADPGSDGSGCRAGYQDGVRIKPRDGVVRLRVFYHQHPAGHNTARGALAAVDEHGVARVIDDGLGSRIGCLLDHQQWSGLQNVHTMTTVHRPFDIQGALKVIFQELSGSPQLPQKRRFGCVRPWGGISSGNPQHFESGFGDPEYLLRGGVPAHQGIPKALDGADTDGVSILADGIGGVQHAAKAWLNHFEDQDRHGGFAVIHAVVQAIGKRRSGVLARHHLLVGLSQTGDRHV